MVAVPVVRSALTKLEVGADVITSTDTPRAGDSRMVMLLPTEKLPASTQVPAGTVTGTVSLIRKPNSVPGVTSPSASLQMRSSGGDGGAGCAAAGPWARVRDTPSAVMEGFTYP